jgi:hypothetical protein
MKDHCSKCGSVIADGLRHAQTDRCSACETERKRKCAIKTAERGKRWAKANPERVAAIRRQASKKHYHAKLKSDPAFVEKKPGQS